MAEKTYRVALIGCGVISRNHLTALCAMDNIKLTALCDIKSERAMACAKEFAPDARIYTDYKDLLKSEKLDGIHICTPHYLHAEMAIAALKLGINVFLEKPMCISREEISEMMKAEAESNAKICVCFQNRFSPEVKKIKEIIDSDGGAISAFGAIFWQRDKEYYVDSGWRGSMKTEGGSVMINQAIHTIDLITSFMGIPKKLWATKSNHHLKGVIDTEDSCEGVVEFESGRRANFYATTSFTGGDKTVVYIKTKNHKIEYSTPYVIVDGEILEIDCTKEYVGKECYGVGHPYLIAEFYKAIQDNTPSPVSLESAQYALRILLAAYESNDEETPV